MDILSVKFKLMCISLTSMFLSQFLPLLECSVRIHFDMKRRSRSTSFYLFLLLYSERHRRQLLTFRPWSHLADSSQVSFFSGGKCVTWSCTKLIKWCLDNNSTNGRQRHQREATTEIRSRFLP